MVGISLSAQDSSVNTKDKTSPSWNLYSSEQPCVFLFGLPQSSSPVHTTHTSHILCDYIVFSCSCKKKNPCTRLPHKTMHVDYDVNSDFGVIQFSGICKYT